MLRVQPENLSKVTDDLVKRRSELRVFAKDTKETMNHLNEIWECDITKSYLARYTRADTELQELDNLFTEMIENINDLRDTLAKLMDKY
ncbi:MAG: hypothetical protein J6M65_01695 [Eubacterium sp.]|jgi:uncharacterized protein YukE|nr:hypothetical protein [Eubacterium sp.]